MVLQKHMTVKRVKLLKQPNICYWVQLTTIVPTQCKTITKIFTLMVQVYIVQSNSWDCNNNAALFKDNKLDFKNVYMQS